MARKNVKKKTTAEQEAKVALCTSPEMPPRPLGPEVGGFRASLIRVAEKKWVNGTVLHYHFLDEPAGWRGEDEQKDAVRRAFQEWKDLGIGLEFVELDEAADAEIRIGFLDGDGSWSYVGRDNVDHARDPAKRTMNFGWDLTTAYGYDTALHEIGHALGFSHEHQNPRAGIVWDKDAVIEYFSGPPNNWSASQTRRNILRQLDLNETDGSEWDKDSIMHYRFPAGLIQQPEKYRTRALIPASGLSEADVAEALRLYPPLAPNIPELRPFESQRIRIEAGEQIDFVIKPEQSRDYVITTFGKMDTVMVLFEEIDGESVFYQGDDDSGKNLNARIEARLIKGRDYVLRIRLYFAEQAGEGALMMW